MPHTTEQFVRRAVGELLRGDAHGKFWCQTCLAKFALETLGAGYHKFLSHAGPAWSFCSLLACFLVRQPESSRLRRCLKHSLAKWQP
jgi:hypothetical protein